jgi:ubiquinone/menaquinone biosynthesis C-methylase UbiE
MSLSQKDQKILDLACGGSKVPGAVGIDKLKLPGVDVVHDLDAFPYPFENGTFDRVVCSNGMEHLENPLAVLAELHRICKNGALVRIDSPHFSSVNHFTDPTHKHGFSSHSFDYLIPGNGLYNLNYYQEVTYKKKSVYIDFYDVPKILEKLFLWLANKRTSYYERHLAFILPANQIVFELEVVK